ncbi:opacity type porin [Pasteurella multocida subsp. multocida OH4807]|nr:opacity type porin [Pasteurella multocida subsp. multocida OH4807]
MKKILFILLTTILFTFNAHANFYIQADLGVSQWKRQTSELLVDLNTATFSQRISLGYRFANMRIALDKTHVNEVEGKLVYQVPSSFDSDVFREKLKLDSTGLSFIYDFKTTTPFKPFLGLRVAVSKMSGEVSGTYLSYGFWNATHVPVNANTVLMSPKDIAGDIAEDIAGALPPSHVNSEEDNKPQGWLYVPLDELEPHVLGYEHYNTSVTRVGIGLLAGASYYFTPNFALVGTVEYNYLGKLDEIRISNYGATLGLRYEF